MCYSNLGFKIRGTENFNFHSDFLLVVIIVVEYFSENKFTGFVNFSLIFIFNRIYLVIYRSKGVQYTPSPDFSKDNLSNLVFLIKL